LEERYSAQWREWFSWFWPPTSETSFVDVPTLTKRIEVGSFLDVYGTCWFKATQMADLIGRMYSSEFGEEDDDWILFHDLWSPAVFHLGYIRSCAGLKFKIAGCLHAGCWDPADFLSQKGVVSWAGKMEQSLFDVADRVFVATKFHKDLILNSHIGQVLTQDHLGLIDKIKVTGFPIFPEEGADQVKDPHLIVFPHRMDPEKQPEKVAELRRMLGGGYEVVCSKEVTSSKKEYYALLRKAGISVSFAKQETWGIAMQESLFAGCIPFVPDRLSYQEMYHPGLRYSTMEELKLKILGLPDPLITDAAQQTRNQLREKGRYAISNIEKEMRSYVGEDLL